MTSMCFQFYRYILVRTCIRLDSTMTTKWEYSSCFLPPLWCKLLGCLVLAWWGFPLCHWSTGRGRRERRCRHPVPQQITTTQRQLSHGYVGMTYWGMAVSYITAAGRSNVARLRHRDELWDDYETGHYSEGQSDVLSGVLCLKGCHNAQWHAFITLRGHCRLETKSDETV